MSNFGNASDQYFHIVYKALKPIYMLGFNNVVSCFIYKNGHRLFLSDNLDYIEEIMKHRLHMADKSFDVDTYDSLTTYQDDPMDQCLSQHHILKKRNEFNLKHCLSLCRFSDNLIMIFQLLTTSLSTLNSSQYTIPKIEHACDEYVLAIRNIIIKEGPAGENYQILRSKSFRRHVMSDYSRLKNTKLPSRSYELINYMGRGFNVSDMSKEMQVSRMHINNLSYQIIDCLNLDDMDELKALSVSIRNRSACADYTTNK